MSTECASASPAPGSPLGRRKEKLRERVRLDWLRCSEATLATSLATLEEVQHITSGQGPILFQSNSQQAPSSTRHLQNMKMGHCNTLSPQLLALLRLEAHSVEKDRFHDASWKMELVGAEGPFQAATAHFLLWSGSDQALEVQREWR